LGKYAIAVATNGNGGLEDVVSNVFGRAKTFTIVEIVDEKIKGVIVLENSSVSIDRGAGPIVAKMLVDKGVNLVLAYVLGSGAAGILKQNNVKQISIKPNTKVGEAVREVIRIRKEEGDTR
jgi:predicted Fe-Mo cluster-binding NifX family protein